MPATSVATRPATPPAAGTACVEAHDPTRVRGRGDAAQVGVGGVDLTINGVEVVAVTGPSGSGTSTLGALLGSTPVIVAGTFVGLIVLSVLIVRSSIRRPIAVTLRGAA